MRQQFCPGILTPSLQPDKKRNLEKRCIQKFPKIRHFHKPTNTIPSQHIRKYKNEGEKTLERSVEISVVNKDTV